MARTLAFLPLNFLFTCFILLSNHVLGKILHIRESAMEGDVICSMSEQLYGRYSFLKSESSYLGHNLLDINYKSGVVSFKQNVNCKTLSENPILMFVESSSIFLSPKRKVNPLTLYFHGSTCAKRTRANNPHHFVMLPRDFKVGSQIVQISDLFPSSLPTIGRSYMILEPKGAEYFSIESKNYELVLQKSLFSCQEEAMDLTIRSFERTSEDLDKQTNYMGLRVIIVENEIITSRRRRAIRNRPPKFENLNFILSVPEDKKVGSEILKLTAIDRDKGDNGVLKYTMQALGNIQSDELFGINSATGSITIKKALDFESMERHFFTVRATDKGTPPYSAETGLTIYVKDINDNKPKFDLNSYSKNIREDVPVGTVILEVIANDDDEDKNAEVRYSIDNNGGTNSVFGIDEYTGGIMVERSLDREKVPSYTLKVKAEDLGTPPLSSIVTVKIFLEDANDCAPEFLKSHYKVTIPEDTPVNTLVETVNAIDRDLGDNKYITYSISNGNGPGYFLINRINGELKVSRSLDYERMPSFSLIVTAIDSGQPPRFNQTTVDISLTDVNDNSPQFSGSEFQRPVHENIPIGSKIYTVQAFDADSGSNKEIVYSIVQTNIPFKINPSSGDILITSNLDRETHAEYTFDIKAQDKGVPPREGTTRMKVIVLDVNDNPPRFQKSTYYGSIAEDSRWGGNVIQVIADDPDKNSMNVFYTITSGNGRGCFRIDSQGWIKLSCDLDFKRDKLFVLTVKASDGELASTTSVRINVTDSNTYAPVFTMMSFSGRVKEDVKIGHVVLKVSATDEDQGENARISYAFVSPVSAFAINSNTGEISAAATLDRESKAYYTFDIVARDNGKPRKSAQSKVVVIVEDVNDNAPKFVRDSYTEAISEDSSINTRVLQVTAKDADIGINQKITYLFAPGGNGNGAFKIEGRQGVIRVAKSLDREVIPEYNLKVIARDKGTPSKESSIVVTVKLRDVKDSPPIFEKRVYNENVREDVDQRTVVTTVKATCQDEGTNANIIYSIVSGNEMLTFIISSFSGRIETRTQLDFEKRSLYRLKVRARSAQLIDDAEVNVNVIDVNDNVPRLLPFTARINVHEEDFPIGPVFRIPAEDPDKGDKLKYKIKKGDDAKHLFLNPSTGEVSISAGLALATKALTIQVEVSDGENVVSATGVILVTLISQQMLDGSIIITINDMTAVNFLSKYFNKFVEKLAKVLSCSTEQIIVFDLKPKTDIIINADDQEEEINHLDIWLALRSGDGKFFYSADHVQELVYFKRFELSKLLGVEVLPFERDLCQTELCVEDYIPVQYKDCARAITVDKPGTIQYSQMVVFRALNARDDINCSCPRKHFQGQDCNVPINHCYSNPCMNNGTCISIEKGFTCLCLEGFVGVNCENDILKGGCPPRKGQVCHNEATCAQKPEGGIHCSCKKPDIVDTEFCELSARSFEKDTFASFPGLKQRWWLEISLEFATLETNALLLYNGRFNDKNDFIALEVRNGKVEFILSIGSSMASVKSNVDVSDGRWYKVTASFQNKTGAIIVSQVGYICETEVLVKFGDKGGNYGCAAAVKINDNKFRSLDLNGPLLLGGVPKFPYPFPVNNKDYIGCIRNAFINHKFLDLANPVFNKGSTAKCPKKTPQCGSSPCQNGGHCREGLGTYVCHCPPEKGNKNCQLAMDTVMTFVGTSLWIIPYRSGTISLPWSHSLRFKTKGEEGILSEVSFGSYKGTLQLKSGQVTYSYHTYTLSLEHIKLNNNKWHHVEVRWERNIVRLIVDYMWNAFLIYDGNFFTGQYVNQLMIGARGSSSSVKNGFRGCIAGIFIGQTQISTKGTQINVKAGCETVNPCTSNTCPPKSLCINEQGHAKCICDKGYVGYTCRDICLLKPCQNGGLCKRTGSNKDGFTCTCPSHYTGRYCETRLETPCRDGFYSKGESGVCGPCQCSRSNNVDTVCDKQTGHCPCKINYYRETATSTKCVNCKCMSEGLDPSLPEFCEVVGGQCPCASGVAGRRCDHCLHKQGELTRGKGCIIINTSCPKVYAEEMWWNRMEFGKLSTEKCPFGSQGNATRFCDVKDSWLEPDLKNCLSYSFTNSISLFKDLNSGVKAWDSTNVMQLTSYLDNGLTGAFKLYLKDIRQALHTLLALLDYESNQSSENLTSAKENRFVQLIMDSISTVINLENKQAWETIQQDSAGSAALLESLEEFTTNLADNLPHIKRTRQKRRTASIIPPHKLFTEKLMLQLYPVQVNDFDGIQLPVLSYEERHDGNLPLQWRNTTTKVVIPYTLFTTEGYTVTSSETAVAFMIIKDIGEILPKEFDAKISGSEYTVDVNSDVVSVNIKGMHNIPLLNPIRIEFQHLEANRSEYICVFWNFSVPNTHNGGWSRDGCNRESVNETHTVCSCDHLSTFAVISDLNLEYPVPEVFALKVAAYVGIALSLLVLVIAFFTFACLSGLKSNANTIHKNLVAAIFLGELIFLVGINKTQDKTACRFIAILLHFFFTSVFSWMFIESLHMYRMLKEKRNIDTGQMTFYYFVGWGVPAIVIGLCAGLTSEAYGNDKFCWMSTSGELIWSFTIPIIVVVGLNFIVFFMALIMMLEKARKRAERSLRIIYFLKVTAVVLPLLGAAFVFSILVVNQALEAFHYLFALFACFQGLFVFLFYVLLDKRVRSEYKNAYIRWKTGDRTYGRTPHSKMFRHSYNYNGDPIVGSPYDLPGVHSSSSTTEQSSSTRSRNTRTDDSTSASLADDSSILDSESRDEEFELKPVYSEKTDPDVSTTQPESSDDSTDEEKKSSVAITSDTSSSEDEEDPQDPQTGWGSDAARRKKAPLYASDGPMHSTPVEIRAQRKKVRTTAEGASSSSDEAETGTATTPTTPTSTLSSHPPEESPIPHTSEGTETQSAETGADTPSAPIKSILSSGRRSKALSSPPSSKLRLSESSEMDSSDTDTGAKRPSKYKAKKKHRRKKKREPKVRFMGEQPGKTIAVFGMETPSGENASEA